MRNRKLLILACIVLCLPWLAARLPGRGRVLSLTDVTGREVAVIPLPDREFTLTYVHSVHRSPVYEKYETDERLNLVLRETKFDALGVGMPYDAAEGELENRDGEFRLTGLARTYEYINIMVTAVPGQGIVVAGAEYPLQQFAVPGSAVTLRARRTGLFELSK